MTVEPVPPAEIRRHFGGHDLAPLWSALRARFESGRPVTRVRVGPMTIEQRSALADLLGAVRLPGEHCMVSVPTLDEILVDATGHSTRAVVEALGGPLGNRAADRQARSVEREQLWQWLDHHAVVRAEPALREWVEWLRRSGVSADGAAAARAQFTQALDVLAALPADGRPLPAFAEDVCGHTHALDDDRRLSAVVLRALAVIHGRREPQDAAARRELWELAGIACDDLSTVVLSAGLRPLDDDPVSVATRTLTAGGLASSTTLAALRAMPDIRIAEPTVWAVENPSVVALALAEFGTGCPPLICASGWPNGAVILLLRRLVESGVEVRYHGDFDGDGLRIAAHVCSKTGATVWRMSTADYLAAAESSGAPLPRAGRVTDAPWDPDLAPTVRAYDAAVSEERVAVTLLDDLRALSRGSSVGAGPTASPR